MIVLDTDVLSRLRGSADTPIRRWLTGLAEATCISIYTVTEVQAGIARVRMRDSGFASELSGWLDQIIATETVLPFGVTAARLLGEMLAIDRLRPLEGDLIIAAIALAEACPLATLNLRDFRLIARQFPALQVIDPLDA